jgi:predicted transcriptional regulator
METYFGDHVIPYVPSQRRSQEKYHTCGFQIGKKYRSHFEIIALIVEAVKEGGQAKFSIMKHANINCGQFNKFIDSLVQMGFIEQSTLGGRSIYHASSRGQSFLRQYYVLLSMLMTSPRNVAGTPLIYEEQFRSR